MAAFEFPVVARKHLQLAALTFNRYRDLFYARIGLARGDLGERGAPDDALDRLAVTCPNDVGGPELRQVLRVFQKLHDGGVIAWR